MELEKQGKLSRRVFVQIGLASVTAVALNGCGNEPDTPTMTSVTSPSNTAVSPPLPTATNAAVQPTSTAVTQLSPTPACADDDETPAQTEGPFYTPNTPERASLLEEGITGTVLLVTGQVLSTDCQPLTGAVLDFWHADDSGEYDNVGYHLRGHQFTDADGNYYLETILPGLYTGRTRHIHVKVQGQTTSLLTTQLYFPDEPANASDGIFHPDLAMVMADEVDGRQSATFDFVLQTS